jgi:hypothetical protein
MWTMLDHVGTAALGCPAAQVRRAAERRRSLWNLPLK